MLVGATSGQESLLTHMARRTNRPFNLDADLRHAVPVRMELAMAASFQIVLCLAIRRDASLDALPLWAALLVFTSRSWPCPKPLSQEPQRGDLARLLNAPHKVIGDAPIGDMLYIV